MQVSADIAARLYDLARPATRPEEVAAAPRAAPAAALQGEEGFGKTATDFVTALREAENTVQQGLMGRADPQAVVEALAATELAVQTAVTVRDRVVEAYQEILRMPV